VLLKPGESYSARLKAGVCDFSGQCTRQDTTWKFTVSKEASQGAGDTSIPVGFAIPGPANVPRAIAVREKAHGTVRLASK
jgi:hypothetical protein